MHPYGHNGFFKTLKDIIHFESNEIFERPGGFHDEDGWLLLVTVPLNDCFKLIFMKSIGFENSLQYA